MAFEVFEKKSAPLAKIPSVTVQRRGLISLNRSAHALIGSPEAVEFLWDGERRIIGLRATEETNPNAYPVRPQSSKSEGGPVLVAGSAFTKFHGIDTSKAYRYVPTLEDGILCIDVSEPGQPVTSNRLRADEDSESEASE